MARRTIVQCDWCKQEISIVSPVTIKFTTEKAGKYEFCDECVNGMKQRLKLASLPELVQSTPRPPFKPEKRVEPVSIQDQRINKLIAERKVATPVKTPKNDGDGDCVHMNTKTEFTGDGFDKTCRDCGINL